MNRDQVEKLFALFAAKDVEKVLAAFADEAVVFDPHYPVPEMKGKVAIRQGFEWGLGNMEKPGFTIRNFWAGENNAVVEIDTHHVFKGGLELKFPQVFVIEAREGLVTRLQAYVPYPPPGIGGLLASVVRLMWKLQGKVK